MQPRAKTLLIVLSIIIVVALAFRWATGDPVSTGGEEAPLTTRFTAPRFVGYHKGERQWSLEAETVEELQEERGERVVRLMRVQDGILYRDGDIAMRFEAAEGLWRQGTNDLTLEGGVVFVNSDGMRFEDGTSALERRYGALDIAHSGAHHLQRAGFRRRSPLCGRQRGPLRVYRERRMEERDRRLGRARKAVYSDEKGTLEFMELEGPAQFVFGDE